MDNLTITTIPTTSRFPTTFTPQTVTTVLIAAAAGGVVLIVLLLVIILLVIMRCRKIFKNRESEMRDGRTERDSLVEVSNDSEMKTDIKYHAARIITENSAYGQQTNKDKEALQYAEQNYVVNKYEQVPSDKLWYKKGTAPAISDNRSVSHGSYASPRYEQVPPEKQWHKKGTAPTISGNQTTSNGLYTSPKTVDSGSRVQYVNGARRYETASGYERAAVYEKAGGYAEMAAVYEQATVYQKASMYEQAAVYEKATTYEKVAMYEQAATYERAITYEKAPPSNVQ